MFKKIVALPIIWGYSVLMCNALWLVIGGYITGLVTGFAACYFLLK